MGEAKKRKHRPCPAVGREITSAECGENRLSRYACPESCPFNPFVAANYSALLEAEDIVDATSVQRRIAERPNDTALRDAFEASRREQSIHATHAAVVRELFLRRDEQGRTFAERWAAAGFPELKNDQRVFIRHKMRIRVALLEVRRVLDEQRFEAVDLLESNAAPMILVDRSLAARAVRFGTYLGWIYPLPHFWRISGTAIGIPEFGSWTPLEIIEASIAHFGGPTERGAQRSWLAENFVRLDRALDATGFARHQDTLASLDAAFGKATYELLVPLSDACAVLVAGGGTLTAGELTPEERKEGFREALTWTAPATQAAMAGAEAMGRPILGRVLLGPREWRVEGLGATKFDKLREQFEALMGERVRFVRERRDDLAGQLAAKQQMADVEFVVPRLREQPNEWSLESFDAGTMSGQSEAADFRAAALAAHRAAWIDQAVPLFEGRTPREAARDPALRGRLLEMMKRQIRQLDTDNLKTGRSDDINGLIRELGLSEVDFPPPPPRPVPKDMMDDDPEFDDVDGSRADDSSNKGAVPFRPPAPALPAKPLSKKAAMRRLDDALEPFAMAADAFAELDASGATILQDCEAIVAPLMSEDEFSAFIPQLMRVWFSVVPVGVTAPEIDLAPLRAAVDALQTSPGTLPGRLEDFLNQCRQPKLLEVMLADMFELEERAPEARAQTPEARVAQGLLLRYVIDALDVALRPKS